MPICIDFAQYISYIRYIESDMRIQMEYQDFLNELAECEQWDKENECEVTFKDGLAQIECFPKKSLEEFLLEDAEEDMVNSPNHYKQGTQEAIDIIEECIAGAPGPITGMLHAQALKYLLRLWYKENSAQDAKKAVWYLQRLIEKLDS